MAKGTCSVEGCEGLAKCRRLCSKHYQRFRNHGSFTIQTAEERAWNRVEPETELPPCPQGAKLIPLSDGESFAIVDEADYTWLTQWTWWPQQDGYAFRHMYNESQGPRQYAGSVLMHRLIMQTPEGMDTDHINRNRLDNRRSNLRITDRAQNNYNTGIWVNNTSGHKGVSWNKRTKSWRAYIGGGGAQGRRIEMGHFKNIEDAVAARLAAEERIIDKCA